MKQYHRMLRNPPKLRTGRGNSILTPEQREQIRMLRLEGIKLEAIAAEYGVSHMTIYRYVKDIDIRHKKDAILQIQEGETDGT